MKAKERFIVECIQEGVITMAEHGIWARKYDDGGTGYLSTGLHTHAHANTCM